MSKKYILSVGDGLGNIIQTTPAFNFLVKKHGLENVKIFCSTKKSLNFLKTISEVYSSFTSNIIVELPKDKNSYVLFKTVWDGGYKRGSNLSEVEQNLKMVGCKEFKNPLNKIGFCGFVKFDKSYDIVISNGYRKDSNIDWSAKSYANWTELVSLLSKKFKVASVGLNSEYVKGTINETGIGLGKTLGLIKNSSLFLGNDSGLYHAANMLKVSNFVIFTFSSLMKNYDFVFHSLCTPVFKKLKCQPCQFKSPLHWIKNKKVCKWMCRDINPSEIFSMVSTFIKEYK